MLVLDTTILIDALHRKDGALIKIIELEETKETLCTTNVDRVADLAAFHSMVSILPSFCRAGSRPSATCDRRCTRAGDCNKLTNGCTALLMKKPLSAGSRSCKVNYCEILLSLQLKGRE
jgi:hypothetical protein